MTTLAETLNRLDGTALRAALRQCCAAEAWVEQMQDHAPFANDEQVETLAGHLWWGLDPKDWRAAFAAHPRIGDLESLRAKFAHTASWASQEQAGATAADELTLQRLAHGNDAYFEKFGFIFIISASGKTAAEMLMALERRLRNDPETELQVAAEEQAQIMQLRLRKLVP